MDQFIGWVFYNSIRMAFVFRSHGAGLRAEGTPGPGAYQYVNRGKEVGLATAPFNQTSPRKIWQENALPGPGAYQTQAQKSNCKAIIKNCGKSYAIIQAPIQSSNFKSASKRFQLSEEASPGPGQYSLQPERSVKESPTPQPNSLFKYLQKSRVHQHRESQVGLLAIGQENAANNRDSVSQSCHLKRSEKKHVPFQSMEERNKPIRPQTSLGPGSYELTRVNQEKEKGNRCKNSQSISKFKKIVPQDYEPEIEIGIKKQEQHKSSIINKKSFNQRKDDFFGSSVSRFTSSFKHKTPGPGEYQYQSNKSKSHCTMPTKKTAFGRSSKQVQTRDIFISPFIKPQNNSDDKAKKNEKKKPVQTCFVFKEPRFKEAKVNSSSEGHLITNQLFLGKENNKKQTNMKKASTKYPPKLLIERAVIKKQENDPRPLSYATEAYTISSKAKQKTQINAPFLSGANRFNENGNSISAQFQNGYYQNTIFSELKQRQSNAARCVSPKGIMASKNPRFDYRQEENQLSPFSYNPTKPASKEFNKLFL